MENGRLLDDLVWSKWLKIKVDHHDILKIKSAFSQRWSKIFFYLINQVKIILAIEGSWLLTRAEWISTLVYLKALYSDTYSEADDLPQYIETEDVRALVFKFD